DVRMTYGSPLRYGEEAYVLTEVIESRATKTTYSQRVYRADMDPTVDKPCVDAVITACVVDRDTFKPVSIKRILPELYARYEELLAEKTEA
ncbi:MAG: acyl-CoA thioesterase, partial [Eggerthellaceae bacterium]|nr:acyl-CoA thioesterase [Eggerthellaceae bacterium]